MATPEDDTTGSGRLIAERYRLETKLGGGAMGRVWSGLDELLRRPVAIKEVRLPAGMAEEDAAEQRERALREARAIAVLTHPNVVTLYDVARDQGEPFVIMELMPSRSLASIVEEHGPLNQTQLAAIADGVAAALETAHQRGIIHRDVKPGNVLIGDSDQIKLSDFGISRNMAERTITRSGILLGTPAFVAPEIVSGDPVTTAADLWGLGTTLFAAAEGHPPYNAGDSPLATVTSVVQDPVPIPSQPGPLTEIITGLMVKSPADRMPLHEVRRRVATLLPQGSTRVFEELMDSEAPTVRKPQQAPAGNAPRTPSPADGTRASEAAAPGTSSPGTPSAGTGNSSGIVGLPWTPPTTTSSGQAAAEPVAQLASDPGPLPFTPREPEPPRRSRWAVTALSLIALLVFAGAVVAGYTTSRHATAFLQQSTSSPQGLPPLSPLVPKDEIANHTSDTHNAGFHVVVPRDWPVYHVERNDVTNSLTHYYTSPDGQDLIAVERFGGFYTKGYSTQRYLDALPNLAAGAPDGYHGVPPQPIDGGTTSEPDLHLTYNTTETGIDDSAGLHKQRATNARIMRRGNDLWILRVTVPTAETNSGNRLFSRIHPQFHTS